MKFVSYQRSGVVGLMLVQVLALVALLTEGMAQANTPGGGTVKAMGAPSQGLPAGIDNAVHVAAAINGGMAILDDGSYEVWGGVIDPAANPAQASIGVPAVRGFAAGDDSLIFHQDGGLTFASGNPIGDSPLRPPGDLIGLVDVDFTFGIGVGLRTDGTVVGWGPQTEQGANLEVPEGLEDIVSVACGFEVGVALRADGTVVQWGDIVVQPPADLSDVIKIDAGGSQVVALRSNGEVVSWGTIGPHQSTGIDIDAGGIETTAVVGAGGDMELWDDDVLAGIEGVYDIAMPALVPPFELAYIQKAGMLPFGKVMPRSLVRDVGAKVLLRSHAIAAESYQWRLDGIDIPGATKPWFMIEALGVESAGDYTLVMTNQDGSFQTAPGVIELDPAFQRIEVTPFGEKQFGDPPFSIEAIASSGLPVSFALVHGPAVIDGNEVTITGNGSVLIMAVQFGDDDFDPAMPVEIAFDTGSVAGPITSFGEVGGRIRIALPWYSTRKIGIEYSPDLSEGSWRQLGNAFLEGAQGVFIDPDPTRKDQPAGFYRAFLRPE